MKRRIGTYKNKILVENAGTNLHKYEIEIKSVSSGNNNTGGGESSGWHYYKLNHDNEPYVEMLLIMCTFFPIEIILSGGKIVSTLIYEHRSSTDYVHPIQWLSNNFASTKNILGMKVHNDKCYTLKYNSTTKTEESIEISEGDLLDKIMSAYENLLGEEIPEEYLKECENMVFGATKEISKEEYYNLK